MSPFAQWVRRTIESHSLAAPGDRVVVGLSGGADSVALTHVLLDLAPLMKIQVVGLAHFHHGLRTEADTDEQFCRQMACDLQLPFFVGRADIGALASARGASVEETARKERYQFLADAAIQAGASHIAVGHTKNDQAETFLLRAIRGAGPLGLAGVLPRAGQVIRPLLDVTRAQVETYLGCRALTWREDASNQDLHIPRNRIRHELLPYVQKHLSPGIVDVLAREATIAREDAEWLRAVATQTARGIVLRSEESVTVDLAGLVALPVPLMRRVAHQALRDAADGRFVGFSHVDALLSLTKPEAGDIAVDLPGVRAERRQGRLILSRRVEALGRRKLDLARRDLVNSGADAEERNGFRYTLSIPGEVLVPESQIALIADGPRPTWPGSPMVQPRGYEVAVDADALGGALTVRSRLPGDFVRPLGLAGRRKKLQDILVDRKVPRRLRDRVPVVTDPAGRVVWIVGHVLSEEFRVTGLSKAVITLKVKRLGG